MSNNKFKTECGFDDGFFILKSTHNGYQWSCICVDTLEQLEMVARNALKYVEGVRSVKVPSKGNPVPKMKGKKYEKNSGI